MNICEKLLLGCLWMLLSAVAQGAEDTIYLEETVISGNQELPKVLYILPWREMAGQGLPVRTLNFEHASVMTPVYPADYKRQLDYRQQLKQRASDSAETPNQSTTNHK